MSIEFDSRPVTPAGPARSRIATAFAVSPAWPVNAIRLASLVLPGLFIAIVLLQPVEDPKLLFMDALAAAEHSGDCCKPYYGFASTVGIMIWCATAAVCLFSAAIFALWRRSRATILFAASAGLFSGWLGFDDAFLIHEAVLPNMGIPEGVVMAVYIGLALLYTGISAGSILAADKWLFAAACGALAFSVGIDAVFPNVERTYIYLEDSAKFFGIFMWASFHITTMAYLFLRPNGTKRPLGTSAGDRA